MILLLISSTHRLKSCSFYTSLTKFIIPNATDFNLSDPGALRQICVSLLGTVYYKTVKYNQVENAWNFLVLRFATCVLSKYPIHLPIDSFLDTFLLSNLTNLIYSRISSCL